MVCLLLAPIVFFIGTIVYNVLKSYDKTRDASNLSLTGTGLLATVLFCIGAAAVYGENGVANMISDTGDDRIVWYSQVFVSFAFFGQMIVFGLMPLLKGISKTLAMLPEPTCPNDCGPQPLTAKDCKTCDTPLEGTKPARKPRTPKPKAETTPAVTATIEPTEPVKPARKPRTPKPTEPTT